MEKFDGVWMIDVGNGDSGHGESDKERGISEVRSQGGAAEGSATVIGTNGYKFV